MYILHLVLKIMARNSKTKTRNLLSTGSRQEAVESVLIRKEKSVYVGNNLRKRQVLS